jgi:HEAT repeat protein
MKPNSSSFALLSRSRVYLCLLIGCAVTLVLTFIEALFVVTTNPLSMLGNTSDRLSAFLLLPVHSPLYLLLPLCECLLVSGGVFFALRPLALYLYLRTIHREQLTYNNLYIPVTASVHIVGAGSARGTGSVEVTGSAQGTIPTGQVGDDLSPSSVQRQQISLVDVLRQRSTHLFLLGGPGTGKTTALRVYHYQISQPSFAFAFAPADLPISISLRDYGLFLKNRQPFSTNNETSPYNSLVQYLAESNLPGMQLLRPYLLSLIERGQLLLLCDGFHEIDCVDRSLVVEELAFLMRHTTNHLVITCREIDYQEQDAFVQLVDGGDATRALLYPIQLDLVYELVERFVERQDRRWRYTAGQVLQLIDRSRLRYHSGNLMMVFALLNSIARVGIERAMQVDTRGSLLRDYVMQLLENESRQPQWLRDAPSKQEVLQLLSTLACAIYCTNSCGALQLPADALPSLRERRGKLDFAELADAVRIWLDEHPPHLPFEAEEIELPVPDGDYARLLQFALSASLIEVTRDGVLSFPHELLASYFVAEHFFAASRAFPMTTLALRLDLLQNIERWCQPVALWAGLLENPLELAERFGALALLNRTFLPSALALGLICVGVVSTPPQADVQRPIILPNSLEKGLLFATHDRSTRESLAQAVTLCAEVGTQEAYYALLPLVTIEGIDALLTLLDYHAVPEMLFQHLQDAVDHPDHDIQVRRITRVLSQFGGPVVDRATELSQPSPERSSRLRAATINILGGTYDQQAVEPLIELLVDDEPVVVERAAHALFRLGPVLSLEYMLATLEDCTTDVSTLRVHRAILHVLRRFMEEQDVRKQVSDAQYQQIVDHILPILTPRYQFEPEIQLQARSLLVDQGRMISMPDTEASYQRGQYVVDALIHALSMQNDDAVRQVIVTLQEIGPVAMPRLIASLQHRSELVRVRVIEVVHNVRDLSALPALLAIIDDPVLTVRQQVAVALRKFAPECIPDLLQLVLTSPSDGQAECASQVLASIGQSVVDPVIDVLSQASPARARLLVRVLEQIHDNRAVPALIALQERSQAEPLLAITLVQALGQFREKQVVAPLLEQVSSTNPQLYEEAVIALSQLGEVALPELLSALDTDQGTVVKQRIQRAILGISPFPGEQLIYALEQSSEAQAMQLEAIFVQQGADAAFVLTKYLLHPDERVRGYIHQALGRVHDDFVVPALLHALYVEELREVASTFLLKYPAVAIDPLVDLLGEPERGNIAAAILPQFGSLILRPLIAALEDQRVTPGAEPGQAGELARWVIITLVRQSSDQHATLCEVIQLFVPPLPENSQHQLLHLLAFEFADVSLSALLVSLEDARLIEPVTDALSLLAEQQDRQGEVIHSLIEALFVAERRQGSAQALIKIGAPAVNPVGELITEEDAEVAQAAQHVLREIGVPALPFIWMAHTDRSSVRRRDAAMNIFRSMSAAVIKDELVSLLVSDKRDDIAMAVSLLLERVHEESRQDDQVMVPELIEYIQLHHMDMANLRIIALLFLLGEQAFFDHLLDALVEAAPPRKQLLYLLLFLSDKKLKAIFDTFEDPSTAGGLRIELAAILGLLKAPRAITDAARRVSIYGLVKSPRQVASPEKLAIALRALGGLLASGQWNARRLVEMRDMCADDDPARELFNVLLGWRYEPLIAQVKEEMEIQRETFKRKALLLAGKFEEEQKRALGLETDLEKLKEEHERRGEKLQTALHDRDALRASMDKLTKENGDLRANLEQATKARTALSTQLERLKRELAALQQPQHSQQLRPHQ